MLFTRFFLSLLIIAWSSVAMAEPFDATGYMPSTAVWEASPVWNYDSGTYMSQGTETFAGQMAHVVYSSHDDAYFYWQITSEGLSLLGVYYPHVDNATGGSGLTATYFDANNVPGLLTIPATVTIGQPIDQSGSLVYQWSGGATATLQYHSVMTFTGIETTTIPFRGKDTPFKALKKQETLQISGKIGESYVNTVANSTTAYAPAIGKISFASNVTFNGTATSFAESLIETNLIPAGLESVSIPVEAGWNLLGNGGDQPISVNATNFPPAHFATLWQWDAVAMQWQFYAPAMSAEALSAFLKAKGFASLTTLGQGVGFWANVLSPTSLLIPVSTLTSANWLASQFAGGIFPAGWNLLCLGQPVTPAQFFDTFKISVASSPPGLGGGADTLSPFGNSSVWAWDSSTSRWRFFSPLMAENGSLAGYLDSKGFADFTTTTTDPLTGLATTETIKLTNGAGFWLWLNQ